MMRDVTLLAVLVGVACATQRPPVLVLANDAAVEAVKGRCNTDHGVPKGRPGNNHPERRRNVIIEELDGVIGVPSAADMTAAAQVHSAGFVQFFESAFVRWRSELDEDSSYLLPGSSSSGDPALIPFHCVKSSTPRSPGLAAEFATYMTDFETPLYESTSQTLRDDLGVVGESVRRLVSADDCAVYALTTHPGHHAGPTYSSGFCYVNNACIACSLLQDAGHEAALLDLDFHGGNGSFDCADAMGVWFQSIHCADTYPWVAMGHRGIELAPGTDWDSGFAAALRAALAALPPSTSVLVVSLGYDTLGSDPEAGKRGGGLGLEPADYHAMGTMLAGACGKVLIVQEGGYDLGGIRSAARALVSGLAGDMTGGDLHEGI